MYNVGFVDLDTSHPRSFVKRINGLADFQVTGVYDRGRVRGAGETNAFCKEFGVEPFSSVAELAAKTDGVMVLSADWATHCGDLMTLFRSGKPCYCDKPVVGSRDEMSRLLSVAEETETPLLAGSGWRWNKPVQEAHQRYVEQTVDHVLASAPNGRFYYGIHAIECLLGLLGPGIEWVHVERCVKDGPTIVLVGHRRGSVSRLFLENPSVYRKLSFTVGGRPESIDFGQDEIHNGICGTFTRMMASGQAPAGSRDLLESVQVSLAIEESVANGATVVVAQAKQVTELGSQEFMAEYIQSYRDKQK